MSGTTYGIPWSVTNGQNPTIDITVTVEQGQLLDGTGILATKGTATADTGRPARYIASVDGVSGDRVGVLTEAVIDNATIAAGTAGATIYLGAAGAYTLAAPVAGDSDIIQSIGFVRPDLRGHIWLQGANPTIL
jgi:hypothetical protein